MPIEDKNGCLHSEENGRFVSKKGTNENLIRKSRQALNYQKAVYICSSNPNTASNSYYVNFPTVQLSHQEYAMVMHELATNLTKEEQSMPVVLKHIRNHTYRVAVLGFGHYLIIGKYTIKSKRRRKK